MVDTKYFSMHTKIAMSMSKVYALSTQTIANEIRHSCMFKYFILWMNCNFNFNILARRKELFSDLYQMGGNARTHETM